MARTAEQYARAQKRKRQRREEKIMDTSHWVTCGWCGNRWNPARKKGWLGHLICPKCELYPTLILHRLVEYKIVKLKKSSKLPPLRKKRVDWGHLGAFDPTRPWMRWVECEFCTIPMCVNNNAEHKVSIPKWRGHIICGRCVSLIRLFNKRLVKMKYLKVKDPK